MILEVMGKRCLRMYEEERKVLEELINCLPRNGRYFEIGTGEGGSALLAYSVRPDLEILTVDAHDQKVTSDGWWGDREVAAKNLKPYGMMHIAMSSEEAFRHGGLKDFDLIYIDGCHAYESVLFDITHWPERLNPGGILAGHDYSRGHKGVVKAVTEVFGSVYVASLGPKSSVWTHIKTGPCQQKVRVTVLE